ncbi:MAG: YjbQ family protein, partial [Nitrospirae bacterium]|nr:YjbQ family protein [Nitrospirota bacterium]
MTFSETVSLSTAGFTDIIDITGKVLDVIGRSGMENGLVTVFC